MNRRRQKNALCPLSRTVKDLPVDRSGVLRRCEGTRALVRRTVTLSSAPPRNGDGSRAQRPGTETFGASWGHTTEAASANLAISFEPQQFASNGNYEASNMIESNVSEFSHPICADSLIADSLVAESLLAESHVAESMIPESPAAQSLFEESLAVTHGPRGLFHRSNHNILTSDNRRERLH
jgi:hypothetical protein